MVSRGITKDSLSKSKDYPCEAHGLRVLVNSVFSFICLMW